jgi:hypothetical protein
MDFAGGFYLSEAQSLNPPNIQTADLITQGGGGGGL